MIKYNCNVCDRIYNEVMIHFTQNCPNRCPWCVDKRNNGVSERTPDVDAIMSTLLKYADEITDVTISGGEPFIYMEQLHELVSRIKNETSLKVNVVTSLPKQCYEDKEMFYSICKMCDNIQFSVQHCDETIAQQMLRNDNYDIRKKQSLYLAFPYKDKVTISINAVRGYLDKKEDILRCIKIFNLWEYKDIKIAEMFDADDWYVDIPKTLGIKMKSPFAHGCKVEYDISSLIPEFDGKLTIKRTCFLRTRCQEASLSDCVKMFTRYIKKKEYFFGVIHEDGTVAPYWI